MSFIIYIYIELVQGIINGCLTVYTIHIYMLNCYMINAVNFFTSRRDYNIGVHDESTYISSPIH